MFDQYYIVQTPDIGNMLAATNRHGDYFQIAIQPRTSKEWFRYKEPQILRIAGQGERAGRHYTRISKAAAVAVLLQSIRLK
jgi:hypothetical protein